MKLISFQIKDCFGFQDSGCVDLNDPTNLIYVLGRNSSGKTSFLTALEYFTPRLKPQDHPNFMNFDQLSHDSPYLLSEYVVKEDDFTIEKFIKVFQTTMDQRNNRFIDIFGTPEYQKLKVELAKQLVDTIYGDLIERAVRQDKLWVKRTASGEYWFSTNQDFNDATKRISQQVPALLDDTLRKLGHQVNVDGQLSIRGNWYQFRQLTPSEIEDLLVDQLPRVVAFEKTYSLLDVLPDVLKIEHLSQSTGPLTDALINYLGKSWVEGVLKVNNPRNRDKLLEELRGRIKELMSKVNHNRATGTELLEIYLDHGYGLQITAITGDKPSFYRHLSDNTKLLFAYHLYMAIHNLNGNILLFDEPNNGFHATAQEQLLGFLRGLSAAGNLVVISTHSEYLIDPDRLTGIRLMQADEEGYLSIRNKWYVSTAGAGDFLALRPIYDAIGLKYGTSRLTICDKVIVTEGVTELLYLRAFHQLLEYEGELHIAPATGNKTIPYVVALLISQELHFKIVADTTVNHKSTKKELQERYGIPDTSICEVTLPPGFPLAKGSGIEDIFSKTDFAKLLTTTGHALEADFGTQPNSKYMKNPHIVPKRIIAHEFNKRITEFNKNDFEEETLTNARRILDFCMNDDWFLL